MKIINTKILFYQFETESFSLVRVPRSFSPFRSSYCVPLFEIPYLPLRRYYGWISVSSAIYFYLFWRRVCLWHCTEMWRSQDSDILIWSESFLFWLGFCYSCLSGEENFKRAEHSDNHHLRWCGRKRRKENEENENEKKEHNVITICRRRWCLRRHPENTPIVENTHTHKPNKYETLENVVNHCRCTSWSWCRNIYA